MTEHLDIEVPYETHRLMVAMGLIEWSDADGVYVLTEKGGKVLDDYTDKTLREIRESPEPYDFYGGPFSNFEASPIVLPHPFPDEVTTECGYQTVEHRFQAMKAVGREPHDWVNAALNPRDAKLRGRALQQLRPDWEEVKYDVMVEALRAKFSKPYYRGLLEATGDRLIREDSPTDFIWGYRSADGTDSGLNLLGKALMQVREENRADR